uniref:Uncharacterized protein n=1 Tax=Kalanchoe fedtschenkoi TaxID=63787 RepID=A0A7N0RBX7_KALFE
MRDEQGNTVLHLATYKKKSSGDKDVAGSYKSYLLERVGNAVNKSNLTSLDLLLMFPSEAGDKEIGDILTSASATRPK